MRMPLSPNTELAAADGHLLMSSKKEMETPSFVCCANLLAGREG